jgi:RNA polymerase sigma-70 factor, ECF subfamily
MHQADRSDPGDLLTMARQGNTQAMGQLFDLYRQYLKLLAHMEIDKRFQAKIDPSDIVQETFLEAHRDFSKFRGNTERELMAWLRQILAGNLVTTSIATMVPSSAMSRWSDHCTTRSTVHPVRWTAA